MSARVIAAADEEHRASFNLDLGARPVTCRISSGQVVADRVLPSGQGEQAVGVDGPVNLDRGAAPDGGAGDGCWSRFAAAVAEQVVQLGQAASRRDAFEADPVVAKQVNDGGVGPDGDLLSGQGGAESELVPANGHVSRRWNGSVHLDRRRAFGEDCRGVSGRRKDHLGSRRSG
jgi:hypothetical protein